MTVTTLDPQSALIVIDLQKGIAALPAVHPMGEVIERASALTETFRRHGLPVVLVNVAGTPAGRTEQASRRPEVFPAGWTDPNAEAHINSIARIFPKPGETGTTRKIIDRLDQTRTLP